MKRYDVGALSITGGEWECKDGHYVRYEDAQADKHAALKELAVEVFPALRDVVDAGKYGALRTKLRALTEGPV